MDVGVSNCGRDIIKGSPPAKKINIAYFEAWNQKRNCLTMNVDQIDTEKYSHLHFAFAEVTRDFKVDISKVKEQFDMFKDMTGIKKIISFGGWDFSTQPGTFSILRDAVKPANREAFHRNLVAFVGEHNLDGIDLDWEYPGAPDIPEIPAGNPEDGLNYHEFLSLVKSTLGDSKSVSFAAPASYWYLKSFPIALMAKTLDYIVYMTYDLHGQWDYGNKWSTPGCPTGDCLRSHVNDTATRDALSMITKAGAPSNKVVVGVASYGRSFKMAQAGCTGPMCRFTGTPRTSHAAKGRCTDTSGYISNAEIAEIIQGGRVNKQWKEAGSSMMVYNDTEWVAYMDDDTKAARSRFYDEYNFAGTTDWAVDLQKFVDGSGGDDDDENVDPNHWAPCLDSYTTFQQLEERKDSIPPHCVEQYLVQVQIAIMAEALKTFKHLVDSGYDDKFKIYEGYVKKQVPAQIDAFMASDKVQKYYKCKETKSVVCCSSCSSIFGCENCDRSSGCKDGLRTVDVECPRTEHEVDMISPVHVPNVTFALQDSDGFWKAIGDDYGIEESWVQFGRRHMQTLNGCQFKDINKCRDIQDRWWYNYPLANRDKIKVYNPRDVVGQSYDKARDLLDRFKIVRDYGDYDELMLWSDVVDATSVPSLTTQLAVDSMTKIVDKAKEIEKKEREEMILSFVTGLLFFIPLVGEAAGVAGLTAARSLLRLISVGGDAGLTVYDVVKDPQNAFMSIFTFLLGAGVGEGGFRKAAESRRSMTTREVDSLGPAKKDLERIETIRSGICLL
ncbi:hypothetical protein CDD83_4590 [Cordyceps sp. RAO-2017]|nr:hypothetical protein CDD83_4590 [Cordyceps sp. RAO-2017]